MSKNVNRGDYLGTEKDEDSFPVAGALIPKMDAPYGTKLATIILRLFGWRVAGRIPNLSKVVVIGAPHTSNWDWILVMLAAYTLDIRISWLGKHTAFESPLGGMFRYFGGIPVDRRAAHGLVEQCVERLEQAKELALCITPEGTRSKVGEWKKGFYHIASQANVPILLASFDYGRKVIGFGPTIYPSGDLEKELQEIKTLYSTVQAKRPKEF